MLRHQSADRRAEPDAEDQRGAGETGEARPGEVVGAVEEQRHRRRPAGDRRSALQEAQREEQRNPVDPQVGEVEQAARREAADDERPPPPEAVGEGSPERREEQVGHHFDGEEEGRVGDRTAELVDHQFLETGDDQRQVQHGDEEAGAGEPRRARAGAEGGRSGGAGVGVGSGHHSGGLAPFGRREILPCGGAG